MTENIDAVCPGEGVMKTPDKSLAGCGESKERRNVCLTSQGSWGNKLHKERHKQKCKGAHERLAGADGAQKKVSDGSRLPTSVMVQLRPHPHPGIQQENKDGENIWTMLAPGMPKHHGAHAHLSLWDFPRRWHHDTDV